MCCAINLSNACKTKQFPASSCGQTDKSTVETIVVFGYRGKDPVKSLRAEPAPLRPIYLYGPSVSAYLLPR